MLLHLRRLGSPGVLFGLLAVLAAGSCFSDNGIELDPNDGIVSVEITPSQITIGVDSTTTLTATVRNGRNEVVSAALEWSSSNQDVAIVDAEVGFVRGVGPGIATITASTGEISGTASVTVRLLGEPVGRTSSRGGG